MKEKIYLAIMFTGKHPEATFMCFVKGANNKTQLPPALLVHLAQSDQSIDPSMRYTFSGFIVNQEFYDEHEHHINTITIPKD